MIGWQVNDHEQKRTNIRALSGIRTHGFSVQAIKAYASDREATGTGIWVGLVTLRKRLKKCKLSVGKTTNEKTMETKAHIRGQ
jgi:hypothetical protein